MNDIRREKCVLRQLYRSKTGALTNEEKAVSDRLICKFFLDSPMYKSCGTVLLYSPIKSEPDVSVIAEQARRDGKRTAYPVCAKEPKGLIFRYVTAEDQLTAVTYGIKEPSGLCDPVDPESLQNAVCLLPGLAFDRAGNRLGHGGGYYDRFAREFHGTLCGIIYTEAVADKIPCECFDLKVDFIITDGGIITVGKN